MPEALTIRLIAAGPQAGAVIGKGGNNVKGLREETGTQIQITMGAGANQERIVNITGTLEGTSKCIKLICQKWKELLGEDDADKIAVKIVLPSAQASAVIGKGGSNIKKLRQDTGAMIYIPSESLPNSTEKAVQVSGTMKAVTDSVRCISQTILDNPIKGSNIAYNPEVSFKAVEQMLSPQLKALPMGQPRGGTGISAIVASLTGGMPIQNSIVPSKKRPGDIDRKDEKVALEMVIPKASMGCVVGKGGSTIEEIKQLSDCSIRILTKGEENVQSSDELKVVISGDKESAAVAKSLINLTIDINNLRVARGLPSNPNELSTQNLHSKGYLGLEKNSVQASDYLGSQGRYTTLAAALSNLKRERDDSYIDEGMLNIGQLDGHKRRRPYHY